MIMTAIFTVLAMLAGKAVQNMRQEGMRRIQAKSMKYFKIGNMILSILGRLIQLRSLVLKVHPMGKMYMATIG
jgi:hypothetical protein